MKHSTGRSKLLVAVSALTVLAASSQAAIIQFNLQGNAGTGLLPGNEVGPTTGGTGGEIGEGITFDDVSKILTINVAWGSLNGFTDLTGNALSAHLHGAASQAANAGVISGLDITNASSNNGSIGASFFMSELNQTHLLAGNTYINVHTAANGGGEIRGNLVAIPEPSSLVLLMGASGGLFIFRRKFQR